MPEPLDLDATERRASAWLRDIRTGTHETCNVHPERWATDMMALVAECRRLREELCQARAAAFREAAKALRLKAYQLKEPLSEFDKGWVAGVNFACQELDARSNGEG